MRIAYDVRLEDALAFSRHHYDHSPLIRRPVFVRRVVFTVLGICFAAAGFFVSDVWYSFLSWEVGAILILGGLVFGPWCWRWQYMRQMKSIYRGGKNAGMLGPKVLEIAGDDLVATNVAGQSRTNISALERIESDDDYAYIYVSAIHAHVVPFVSTEGDLAAFVALLEGRMSGGTPSSDGIRRSAGSGAS
jgi:hypothetical protein